MRRATLLVIGTAGGQVTAPTAIPGLTGVTDLTPGPAHVLALRSDHTVWSWGERLRDVIGAGGEASMSVSVAP